MIADFEKQIPRLTKCALFSSIALTQSIMSPSLVAADELKPNVIVIFTDDQGYNDLGCFGSKTIKTPQIDRMAKEGKKLTSFMVPSPVWRSRRGVTQSV